MVAPPSLSRQGFHVGVCYSRPFYLKETGTPGLPGGRRPLLRALIVAMNPHFFRPAISKPQNFRETHNVPEATILKDPSDVFPPSSTLLSFESNFIVELASAEQLQIVLVPVPKLTFDMCVIVMLP